LVEGGPGGRDDGTAGGDERDGRRGRATARSRMWPPGAKKGQGARRAEKSGCASTQRRGKQSPPDARGQITEQQVKWHTIIRGGQVCRLNGNKEAREHGREVESEGSRGTQRPAGEWVRWEGESKRPCGKNGRRTRGGKAKTRSGKRKYRRRSAWRGGRVESTVSGGRMDESSKRGDDRGGRGKAGPGRKEKPGKENKEPNGQPKAN